MRCVLLPKVDDAAVVTMGSKDDNDNDEKKQPTRTYSARNKVSICVQKGSAAVVVTGKFGAPLTLMAAARGSNLVRN